MRNSKGIILVLICLLAVGCSTTMPGGLSDASAPATYGNYTVLGPAEGTSKGTIVFGIQASKPDLQQAIEQAVRTRDGDALVHERWYSKTTNWVILPVTTVEVIVHGDVVKYTQGGAQ